MTTNQQFTQYPHMEKHNWKIEFKWIKANTGNELADQLAKEAATNYIECYKIPKSTVKSELSENSVKMWQSE